MTDLIRRIGIAVSLLVLSAQAFASLPSYTGHLSGADGGLLGAGSWLNKLQVTPAKDQADWSAPSITWTVSQTTAYSWHYDYTLSVYGEGVSHSIIEVSPTFGYGNIHNTYGTFCSMLIDDYRGDSSNPGPPSTIHGIKFESTSGPNFHVQFDSDRVPVWGDIYAKGGKDRGDSAWNAVWNAGFRSPDTDPLAPIGSGSYQNHMLVPDTTTSSTVVTPEPASFVSLAVGLIGLLSFGYRRRR
jgi:hypothetical protein